jgi:hypothetical protein
VGVFLHASDNSSLKNPPEKEGFLMFQDKLTPANFWRQDFTRHLPARGKLVLRYALDQQALRQKVIAEDAAAATGVEYSEVCDWLRLFLQREVFPLALVDGARSCHLDIRGGLRVVQL